MNTCQQCFHVLAVDWSKAAPAPEIVQQAVGGDVDALHAFFDQSEWLREWSLPLWITWGTAAEWITIAEIWRATRTRRERFLTLEEISAGWSEESSDG